MLKRKRTSVSVRLGVHRTRRYPVRRDEFGRSQRQQSFDLFIEGFRPGQINRDKMLNLPMKTLLRYFEDWKKQRGCVPYAMLRKWYKDNPTISKKLVNTLADYFEVSPEIIISRFERPWGIAQLANGDLPDVKRERACSEQERRLEAALGLVRLAEFFGNSPEQVNQLAKDIVMLPNNNRLVIQRKEGKVIVRKEKLAEEP